MKRDKIFQESRQLLALNSDYTKRTCLMDCKIYGQIHICNCVTTVDPVFLQETTLKNYSYCTLNQTLACQHVEKVRAMRLWIKKCRQRCVCEKERTEIQASISSLPLNSYHNIKEDNFSRDHLILRFCYTWLTEYHIISKWQIALEDMLSNLGGLLSLFFGMSLIGVIQVPIAIASKLVEFVCNKFTRFWLLVNIMDEIVVNLEYCLLIKSGFLRNIHQAYSFNQWSRKTFKISIIFIIRFEKVFFTVFEIWNLQKTGRKVYSWTIFHHRLHLMNFFKNQLSNSTKLLVIITLIFQFWLNKILARNHHSLFIHRICGATGNIILLTLVFSSGIRCNHFVDSLVGLVWVLNRDIF